MKVRAFYAVLIRSERLEIQSAADILRLWTDGRVLVLGGEAEQILMADMEIGAVDGVRDSINVYRDRLPEVYKI